MKIKTLAWTTTLILFATMAARVRLAAQDANTQAKTAQHHHYKLIDMGTFGGPQSNVAINNIQVSRLLNSRGTMTGWADTSAPDPFPSFCFNEDCYVSHAFRWYAGVRTDLGALVAGLSSQAYWISSSDLIAGVSENGEIDPLISGFPEFRAVLWRNNKITDVGTLPEGGYESSAYAVNSKGQVIGWALNTVPDPYTMIAPGFATTETRAFLWQNGIMQDLGTLGGTDAQAVLINDSGQVAGWSFTSSNATQAPGCNAQNGFLLTTGSFFWQNGNMVDLGTLGGTCTLAADLNNRGQIAGGSYLPGDLHGHPFLWQKGVLTDLGTLGGGEGFGAAVNDAGHIAGYAQEQGDQIFHGFLWKHDVMTDLGTVDSDQCSFSFGLNSKDQVLGFSLPTCDGSTIRASLWEDGGPMVDLNALVVPGSSLYLTIPGSINDRGEIAGLGALPNGDERAFLVIPCDDDHPNIEGCDYSMADTSAAAIATRPVPGIRNSTTPSRSAPGLGGAANPMLRRFGPRLGPWYRRFGVPTPAAKPASSAASSTTRTGTDSEPLLDERKADPIVASNYCIPGHCHRGYCVVDDTTGQLELNGECFTYRYPLCLIKPSSNCPRGQKVTSSTDAFCGGLSSVRIDLARPCSFF